VSSRAASSAPSTECCGKYWRSTCEPSSNRTIQATSVSSWRAWWGAGGEGGGAPPAGRRARPPPPPRARDF
jgi:hypothetical protein